MHQLIQIIGALLILAGSCSRSSDCSTHSRSGTSS